MSSSTHYDVVIIGAGVAGCCLARELSRYTLRCAVLEAGNDIAYATSRANSGIVHAGYDPLPGSLKAKYCARGARLFAQWAEELEFGYVQNGSLVLAFSEEDLATLHKLEEQAHINGVTVELLDAATVREREPHVSEDVIAALFAPYAGVCDPYGLSFGAAEHASEQGVDFFFENEVTAIEQDSPKTALQDAQTEPAPHGGQRTDSASFTLTTAQGTRFTSRLVVNAAGVHADEVNALISKQHFSITPVRGEYLLYDTPYGALFKHVLFQTPGAMGKGTLITPTTIGNLIVGPNAVPQESKDDVATTAEGLETILSHAQRSWPEASLEGVITNFAGLRAKGENGDFIIGEAPDVEGFYNLACFESPGLTAAPAVAEDLAPQLASRLGLAPNPNFSPYRKRRGRRLFAAMSMEERALAIQENPEQGQILCRCCSVSRADVIYELTQTLPILCLDALKWRTGVMMGRCHGGFCGPELMELVYEYTGIKPEYQDKRFPHSPYVKESSVSYGAPLHSSDAPLHSSDAPQSFSATAQSSNTASSSTDDAPHSSPTTSPVSGAPLQAASEASRAQSAAKDLVYDVVVVGAGAAGMAAATAALKEGATRVALLDREDFLGGILRQCIHNGFGLTRFRKELTGPEYASREAAVLSTNEVDIFLGTTALSIEPALPAQACSAKNAQQSDNSAPCEHTLIAVSNEQLLNFTTKALVLATGSRERGQGALNLAGSRPSGVHSAGSAQNLINLKGCLPGKKILIQGSGDIGLIMARRCLYMGADVLGVFARSSQPSGLRRNVRQCLDDYGIPFYGNKVATRLEGEAQLEAVWISQVDPTTKQVIAGSEERWACDALLLSIGLVPENELAISGGVLLDSKTGGPLVDMWLETNVAGIYSCGNSLHIHDLADYASAEGERAGKAAARRALGLSKEDLEQIRSKKTTWEYADSSADEQAKGLSATSSKSNEKAHNSHTTGAGKEQARDALNELILDGKAAGEPSLVLTCVRCPKGCELQVYLREDGSVESVTGEGCKRGLDYASEEVTAPTRIVTASLPVLGSLEPISVKTAEPIDKRIIFEVLTEAKALSLQAPLEEGTVLLENVAGTGVELIATKTVLLS